MVDIHSVTEHDDTRKYSDACYVNSVTGEATETSGQFAKRIKIADYTPSLECSILKRIYLAYKRFVAKCTPESTHHARRESRLNVICGFD